MYIPSAAPLEPRSLKDSKSKFESLVNEINQSINKLSVEESEKVNLGKLLNKYLTLQHYDPYSAFVARQVLYSFLNPQLTPEIISRLTDAQPLYEQITQHFICRVPNVFSEIIRLLKLKEPTPIADNDPTYEALIDFINGGSDFDIKEFITKRNLDPSTFKMIDKLCKSEEESKESARKGLISLFKEPPFKVIHSRLDKPKFEKFFLSVMRFVAAKTYANKEQPVDKLFPQSTLISSFFLDKEAVVKEALSQLAQKLNTEIPKPDFINDPVMKELLDKLSGRFSIKVDDILKSKAPVRPRVIAKRIERKKRDAKKQGPGAKDVENDATMMILKVSDKEEKQPPPFIINFTEEQPKEKEPKGSKKLKQPKSLGPKISDGEKGPEEPIGDNADDDWTIRITIISIISIIAISVLVAVIMVRRDRSLINPIAA